MKTFRLSILTLLISALPAQAMTGDTWVKEQPKLVLSIVVDQFRADYIWKNHDRLLPPRLKTGKPGGLRYLLAEGAYFPQAQFGHWYCVTAVGHATLYTGASPSSHGIVNNYWFDPLLQKKVSSLTDAGFPIVGSEKYKEPGISPKNLIGTTITDEFKNRFPTSKVVSIALKDRGAVLPGGHQADLALWFDSKAYQWISSRYYLPTGELPPWVKELNSKLVAPKEGGYDAMATPLGYSVHLQAVDQALKAYQLGKGKQPDWLALSISNFDYAGHRHGPDAKEMEEMTLALDRTLSELFEKVDRQVPGGLKNVLISFSADHGVGPSPAKPKLVKVPHGTIKNKEIDSAVESALNDAFGKPSTPWIALSSELALTLHPKALQERKISASEAEAVAKSRLIGRPGVADVLTATQIELGQLPRFFQSPVSRTFYKGRTANILVIPNAFYIDDEDQVTHMTGYSYDRSVPLFFAGFRVKPGVHPETVDVTAMAPTLAAILNILKPAVSEGEVLKQVFKD